MALDSPSIIYKIVLAYDGTDYYGWQKQPNVPSIQETLEETIKKTLKQKTVKTMGSGRTDAGVHSFGQVVKLTLEVNIEPSKLKHAINQNLPIAMKILECDYSEDYHPTRDALEKTYRYYFTSMDLLPFDSRQITILKDSFDIEDMKNASKLFVGEKSFHNYFCVGTPVSSYVRRITDCKIVSFHHKGQYGNEVEGYFLEVTGNGFLKQMVRMIFGAIFAHGRGKISLDAISDSFLPESQDKVSKVAPAEGLVLYNVLY